MSKTGILLINLGTPDNPDVASVRRYLKEFLSDPRVLDIPWLIRQVLLYGLILPFRAPKSAKAYAAIWDKIQGSPLLFNSKALAELVQASLGENYHVVLGMRYGNPSIGSALATLLKAGCHTIRALPLFPQYSSAATGSAIESLLKSFTSQWNLPALSVIDKFYDNEHYINAFAQHVQSHLSSTAQTHILFSYHSLPVRQIYKGKQACKITCFENAPCPAIQKDNDFCYRAQCYETSKQIAQRCQIDPANYSVAFQSRLGRTVWVGPDVESTFCTLIAKGVKEVKVVCPSFVADCLETLEEIGIRAKEQWKALGGNSLSLIPCLNAEPIWVKAVTKIVMNANYDCA